MSGSLILNQMLNGQSAFKCPESEVGAIKERNFSYLSPRKN